MATVNKEALFTLKPSIINCIIPIFLKRLFFYLLFFVPLSIVGYFFNTLIPFFIIGVAVLVAFFSLIAKILVLYNTNYYFYEDTIKHEFEFINIKEKSVPYRLITAIELDISLWDRLSKAGDIKIYSANDDKADLVLQYVKNPHMIKNRIEGFIRSKHL